MNPSSTVSVVIPCRNAAPWLPMCLDSLQAQTRPADEILVVDDGSTDGSPDIVRRYPGVRLLANRGKGQSAACNTGWREARGRYIKFLDADDLLGEEALRIQMEALEAHPGQVAYGEWARFYRDPGEALFVHRPEWRSAGPVSWIKTSWCEGEPMMQCALYLLPRELLKKAGGWDERLSLINDLECFTRLILASAGVVFTPGARLYYRSGLPGSLSARRDPASWKSAHLSVSLAAGHLIRASATECSRRVASVMLREIAYAMYPNCPDLVADLERQAAQLHPAIRPPRGGNAFRIASQVIGWKLARRLQILAGKHPRPGLPAPSAS